VLFLFSYNATAPIVCSADGGQTLQSTDLTLTSSQSIARVIKEHDTFFLCSGSYKHITGLYYSVDGLHWSIVAGTENYQINNIAYKNDQWLISAYYNSAVYTLIIDNNYSIEQIISDYCYVGTLNSYEVYYKQNRYVYTTQDRQQFNQIPTCPGNVQQVFIKKGRLFVVANNKMGYFTSVKGDFITAEETAPNVNSSLSIIENKYFYWLPSAPYTLISLGLDGKIASWGQVDAYALEGELMFAHSNSKYVVHDPNQYVFIPSV
jgi:hypothetical protein